MSSPSGAMLDRLGNALRVPELIGGRYRVLRELGRGGMGIVYLCQDETLDRPVAVKIVDPAIASPELEARLQNEARLIGRLSHPGIVPIHDLGWHDELTLYYVMKHVDGVTLARWLRPERSRTELLRLFQRLCDPIAFAHAQGIVHRDLQPANVMIGTFGEVLVMDWGLAARSDGSAPDDPAGTPGYRDPFRSEAPVPPVFSDLYSLGAMLYFLLAARHPPAPGTALHPRQADDSIDTRLDAICAKTTEAQWPSRYESVRALEADLVRYLDAEPIAAYRERWHETAGRWIRRHQLVISLLLMYLVMRAVVQLFR